MEYHEYPCKKCSHVDYWREAAEQHQIEKHGAPTEVERLQARVAELELQLELSRGDDVN